MHALCTTHARGMHRKCAVGDRLIAAPRDCGGAVGIRCRVRLRATPGLTLQRKADSRLSRLLPFRYRDAVLICQRLRNWRHQSRARCSDVLHSRCTAVSEWPSGSNSLAVSYHFFELASELVHCARREDLQTAASDARMRCSGPLRVLKGPSAEVRARSKCASLRSARLHMRLPTRLAFSRSCSNGGSLPPTAHRQVALLASAHSLESAFLRSTLRQIGLLAFVLREICMIHRWTDRTAKQRAPCNSAPLRWAPCSCACRDLRPFMLALSSLELPSSCVWLKFAASSRAPISVATSRVSR